MKKILLTILAVMTMATSVFAASTKQEALAFFNSYVNAANNYEPSVTTMYSPTARIIREVVKPDGSTVTRVTNTQRYISEMRKAQVVAKVRKYKNNYTNIKVDQTGTDTYRLSSLRQPSGESYKLKAYFVVKKQPNGKWLIIEEMMQTKVQMLINAQ
ncbi:MAG: DUF1153 domain-containing protein [Cyanobacteria bacterium RUI128]|nr:DUF1153 domain-containing protein [Cyanobacteria bacterium RUI128]